MPRKWVRLATLLLSMVVVLAPAAMASASTIQISTELAKEQTQLVWGCSAGERFVSGTADWFRREGAKLLTTTQAVADPNDPTSGVYVVPKGARFVSFTQECGPVTQTVSFSGIQVGDEIQHADCPADYPYVTSTFTFTGDADGDLSTTDDQFLVNSRFALRLVGNDPGVPNYTGFEFRLEPGMAWYGEVVCSVFPAT